MDAIGSAANPRAGSERFFGALVHNVVSCSRRSVAAGVLLMFAVVAATTSGAFGGTTDSAVASGSGSFAPAATSPAAIEMTAFAQQAALDACRIPTPSPQATTGDESFQPNTGFPFVMDNLPSEGFVKVVVVPVDWDSYRGDPGVLAAEFGEVDRFVSFYEDVSNGDLSFEVESVDEWLRVPGSPADYSQEYESDFNLKLAQAAVDASDSRIDYSDVAILIVVLPENSPIPAGQARFADGSAVNHGGFQGFDGLTRGMQVVSDEGRIPNWMSAGTYFDDPEGFRNEWSYYVHEVGHMLELADYYLRFGLDLRYSPRPEQEALEIPIGPFSTWSVMGNQDGPSRTMNAWSRWLVGWLDDEIYCFDARVPLDQAFDVPIVPLDSEREGAKAVIVRTGEHTGFVIESRRPIKWDEGLEAYRERADRNAEGVLVYTVDTSFGTQEGALRLITPNDRYVVYLHWGNRTPPVHLDALFAEGDEAAVAGFEVELRQLGDLRDVVRLNPNPHGFDDVPTLGWQNDAVSWMRSSGVTTGCSATHFCPDQELTREQQITFLWRYAGEPASGGTLPFRDVEAGKYYTNPVSWAYNNGITNGISPTSFGTGRPITRAQAVTFLWRQAGEPVPSAANPFVDVPAGTYYTDPVRWALESGVTTGTSATTFAPNQAVTRVQFAAFLSRYDDLTN